MDTRAVAKALVTVSNVLLGVSLLVVLVWWQASVRLFVAGAAVYGVARLMARGASPEGAALAMPEGRRW